MRRCYTYFSHSNFSFNILCFFWTHAELEQKNSGSPSEFGCSSKATDRGDVRWFPHNYLSLLSCKWSLPNSLWHPQLTFTGREAGNPPPNSGSRNGLLVTDSLIDTRFHFWHPPWVVPFLNSFYRDEWGWAGHAHPIVTPTEHPWPDLNTMLSGGGICLTCQKL